MINLIEHMGLQITKQGYLNARDVTVHYLSGSNELFLFFGQAKSLGEDPIIYGYALFDEGIKFDANNKKDFVLAGAIELIISNINISSFDKLHIFFKDVQKEHYVYQKGNGIFNRIDLFESINKGDFLQNKSINMIDSYDDASFELILKPLVDRFI
ncbi:hypothetical protein V6667_03555 [Neisseria leonii]|uniref:Uncharacterized protein n=1 Tax=Neisseria leonii TaxID=2995413 RepID=A0A9X4IDC9_9NEIS|nr:hypothetical protein [Neisseria sp. 51.81]MDD9327072.1 hypothetical protein [Neisseria sp. 51.81]